MAEYPYRKKRLMGMGTYLRSRILQVLVSTTQRDYYFLFYKGFMVSVFCNTDTSATFMGLGSFFPLAMLSGMIWPLEGMHYVLRSIGWILPITLSTESFRALSARDWSITHPTVYKGFLSASGWIAVFMLVTIIVVKKNNGLRNVTK